MNNNFLEVKNVTFKAGGQNKVNNVSFSIEKEGDIICLLGPSGIGKTTILRSIAGLEKIESGTIKLKGKHYHQITLTLNLKIEIYHFHFKKIAYILIIQLRKTYTLELKEKIQIKKRK